MVMMVAVEAVVNVGVVVVVTVAVVVVLVNEGRVHCPHLELKLSS